MKEAGRSNCESVTAEDLGSIVRLDLSGPLKAITALEGSLCGAMAEVNPEKWELLRELWDERRCRLEGIDSRQSALAADGGGSGPELHALQRDDFAGLSSLQNLRLKDNWLTTLPAGVLGGLGQLRVLDLRRNLLASLPDSLFDDTPFLGELYAHGNRLTTLPEGLFDGLAELNTVDFYGNRIARLPDGIFDETPTLAWVGFTRNELTELPKGLFAHMPNLRSAEFGGNNLTELPEKLFDGHTKLQNVEFPANGLSEFPVEILESQELRSVSFFGNQLTSLPAEAFRGHPKLRRLDFANNSLTELPDSLVTGLTELEYFYVDFNRITIVPDGLFEGNESLRARGLLGKPDRATSRRFVRGLAATGMGRLRRESANPAPRRSFRRAFPVAGRAFRPQSRHAVLAGSGDRARRPIRSVGSRTCNAPRESRHGRAG